jgi:serine/threonine protein kinase
LKVFKDGNKKLFNDELRAYRKLSENRHDGHSHKGMVRFLGEFSHVDPITQSAEHNILLEYGDNDLAEYFYRTPPVLTSAILKFWDDLSHVIIAICGLHVFETTRLNQPTKYQGYGSWSVPLPLRLADVYSWHADIKPDNILLVRGEFKLADPGFARFKKQKNDQQSTGKDLTVLFGGTTTYGVSVFPW